jgi:hypothetical protein
MAATPGIKGARAKSLVGRTAMTRFFIAMILLIIVLGSAAKSEKDARNGEQPAN